MTLGVVPSNRPKPQKKRGAARTTTTTATAAPPVLALRRSGRAGGRGGSLHQMLVLYWPQCPPAFYLSRCPVGAHPTRPRSEKPRRPLVAKSAETSRARDPGAYGARAPPLEPRNPPLRGYKAKNIPKPVDNFWTSPTFFVDNL